LVPQRRFPPPTVYTHPLPPRPLPPSPPRPEPAHLHLEPSHLRPHPSPSSLALSPSSLALLPSRPLALSASSSPHTPHCFHHRRALSRKLGLVNGKWRTLAELGRAASSKQVTLTLTLPLTLPLTTPDPDPNPNPNPCPHAGRVRVLDDQQRLGPVEGAALPLLPWPLRPQRGRRMKATHDGGALSLPLDGAHAWRCGSFERAACASTWSRRRVVCTVDRSASRSRGERRELENRQSRSAMRSARRALAGLRTGSFRTVPSYHRSILMTEIEICRILLRLANTHHT
jgi:hypothetical protein